MPEMPDLQATSGYLAVFLVSPLSRSVGDRSLEPVEPHKQPTIAAEIYRKRAITRGHLAMLSFRVPVEGTFFLPNLVGDGGLEPPTSTMSTWRSTPELIAQHIDYVRFIFYVAP